MSLIYTIVYAYILILVQGKSLQIWNFSYVCVYVYVLTFSLSKKNSETCTSLEESGQ